MNEYLIAKDGAVPHKIEAYLDLLQQLFVKLEYVSVDALDGKALSATIQTRNVADLNLHVISSTKQHLERVPTRSGFSELEYFLIALQVNGTGEVIQDGKHAVLQPGDISLYDTTRPYELKFDDRFQQIVVSVPREVLRYHVPSASNLTAQRITGSSPLARLLSGFLAELPCALDGTAAQTQPVLSDVVLDLISANLRTLPAAVPDPGSRMKRFHTERIRQYIAQHLTDPELGIGSISQALEMSVSAIYRAFDEEPRTVIAEIWYRRLDAARAALARSARISLLSKLRSTGDSSTRRTSAVRFALGLEYLRAHGAAKLTSELSSLHRVSTARIPVNTYRKSSQFAKFCPT